MVCNSIIAQSVTTRSLGRLPAEEIETIVIVPGVVTSVPAAMPFVLSQS